MVISPLGYVGVNTDSPNSIFHIYNGIKRIKIDPNLFSGIFSNVTARRDYHGHWFTGKAYFIFG